MRNVLRWSVGMVAIALIAVQGAAGCGSENSPITPTAGDGGDAEAGKTGPITSSRAPTADCKPEGQGCGGSGECCTASCDAGTCGPPANTNTGGGACKLPNAACGANTECCTGSCLDAKCGTKQCVADNEVCGADGECCGGSCVPDATGRGTCKPLNNACRTSGNPCTDAGQCCSKLCNAGLCSSAVSFCFQQGESCATDVDCCTGNCTRAAGAALGTCGGVLGNGAGGCNPSGTVCTAGSGVDGVCEQSCCSRSCGPFGAQNGFRVCQPPSGCKPTGEICRETSDCCGWEGSPEPKKGFVECDKPAGAAFGRCNNGNACREPGSICKVGGPLSCSAENNCCETLGQPSGNCNNTPENCCRQDALGIPRCLVNYVGDCSVKPPAGTVCATSADCCGAPCINNRCLAPEACVQTGNECTSTSDCCRGLTCVAPPGSTKGTCGGTLAPDGGTTGPGPGNPPPADCALYGQLCRESADCCASVPCSKPIGSATGTCRYP